ncbi:hypothetical protein PybrP1_003274, partial [[Pythium] brassicae (nom. inval.)]
MLDDDLLFIWPEVRISPFGVVDKRANRSQPARRTIRDLSYPAGESYCDVVAREVLRVKSASRDTDVMIQAGDAASTFLHVYIHAASMYFFAGFIPEDNA